MSAPTPIISVIVVCKNPGLCLQAALASVWAQHGTQFELIVIDGGSSDGSREWLESQRTQITMLVSEPDTGVYDAMNKGVVAARGEWILFLGADDRLINDKVLGEVGSQLQHITAKIAVGEAAYDDRRIYSLHPRPNPRARNFVHHQATLYRRTLFSEHGGFDTSLEIMADYEFNLRLWKKHIRFEPLPIRIAACHSGGLSDAGRWRGYAEEIQVRHRHFALWRCVFWDALSVVRFLRKKFLRSITQRRG